MGKAKPVVNIGAVVDQTGLSAAVVRVWESRYGAIVPQRSSSGHRRYSERDIARLNRLRTLVDSGHRIGTIARLSDEDLEAMAEALGSRPRPAPSRRRDNTASMLSDAIDMVAALDGDGLLGAIEQASVELSRVDLIDQFLVPLMHAVGDRCAAGTLRTVHEHLATAVVRAYLENLRAAYPPDDGAPVVLVATPAGQHHELGGLLVAVTARTEGWHVIYLGANLPAEEIAAAAHAKHAQLVALSVTFPADDPQLSTEITRLGRLLPKNAKLVVGGRSAEAYAEALEEARTIRAASLPALRQLLDQVRSSGRPRGIRGSAASASCRLVGEPDDCLRPET